MSYQLQIKINMRNRVSIISESIAEIYAKLS